MSRRRRGRSRPQQHQIIEEKALGADFPFDLLIAPTNSGAPVTAESALTCPAVSAAVSLISGMIGTLPLRLYNDVGQGKVEAEDHGAYEIVTEQPNAWTSSSALRAQLATDALLHGNGYAIAHRLPDGSVYELLRLMPGSVVVEYNVETLEPQYRHTLAGAGMMGSTAQPTTSTGGDTERVYHWSDVVHVRAPLSVDGITGTSPVYLAREAIALSITLEAHAARLFANGARPAAVLSFPEKLDKQMVQLLRDSWTAAYSGANAGRTAVLEAGGKFQPLTMTSVDAEFLAMRNFQIVEIARAFDISPVLIGDTSKATFSNAEQMARQFVDYTLSKWMRGIEDAYSRVMLTPEERRTFSIEYDASDLLRGDSAARAEFISKMRAAGVMTSNEARALESLPARTDGDQILNPFVQSAHAPQSTQDQKHQ